MHHTQTLRHDPCLVVLHDTCHSYCDGWFCEALADNAFCRQHLLSISPQTSITAFYIVALHRSDHRGHQYDVVCRGHQMLFARCFVPVLDVVYHMWCIALVSTANNIISSLCIALIIVATSTESSSRLLK